MDNEKDDIYYDIPDASKYKMRKRGREIYRILKSGRLRKLKKFLVIRKDGYRYRQTAITYDDGKRRTINVNSLYNKLLILNGETPVGCVRELPEGSEWYDTYGLSPDYFVNRQGDIYKSKKDALGNIYYKPCNYAWDTSNERSHIERANLYTNDFRPRTYTRTAIKKMWLAKSGWLPMEEILRSGRSEYNQ